MRARATVRLPDGTQVDVGHGDLVGRLWTAAICLDDPRVSEAHALVSLRGDTLKLLALRGRFAVHGRLVSEATLVPGLELELADGLMLVVDDVEVPESVLGLTTEGMAPRPIPGTCALVADSLPGLAPPTHPAALALVWAVPQGWRIRPVGGTTRPLVAGDTLELGGRQWHAVSVATQRRVDPTRSEPTLEAPIRVVARYDTVHLFQPDREPVILHGLSARVVSELVAFSCPVHWSVLASELWPQGGTRKQLDMALVRLRARLREHRVRTDLVRTDGTGTIELFLRPGDKVEDQV